LGAVICCSIILFSAYILPVKAQLGRDLFDNRVVKKPPSPKQPRRPTPIRIVTVIERVVRKPNSVRVKISNLTVASEPGSKILLEGLMNSVKSRTKEISKNNPDKTVIFEDLAPGKYSVTSSLDGYEPQKTVITIVRDQSKGITLDLEPYKYQLNIETNVSDGEVRYAPARFEGTNPNKTLKTTETGGYCIVPIKKGKAIINELQKGYYNIDIRPEAVEYEPILAVINVPTALLNEKGSEASDLQTSRIELEKKISTGTFGANWVEGEWDLPKGWRLQNGRQMKTAGLAGIALPRNEQYRYYTNFEMISDVKMTDENSIGFVLRAINSQNYYSLYISGAKAPEPFTAIGYVVEDGKPKVLFSSSITGFDRTIKAKQSFRIIIKSEETKDKITFKIFIEDIDTGKPNPVGNMEDPYKTFRKGAVGIIGRESADSAILSFNVCANSCPKN